MCSVVSEYGMPYCRRLLQADILPQKLSRRNAMVILLGIVGRGLDQHRHAQVGQPQGVGNGALVAEVGQGHDDAVDASRLRLEQVGAAPGLLPGFDRAVLALFRSERDHIHAGRAQHPQHFFAAALGQMIGEESTVADDQAHRHFFRRHTLPL